MVLVHLTLSLFDENAIIVETMIAAKVRRKLTVMLQKMQAACALIFKGTASV